MNRMNAETMEATEGHRNEPDDTSPAECHAMRLLDTDGWTQRKLAMCFELGRSTVQHHVSGACDHEKDGENDG